MIPRVAPLLVLASVGILQAQPDPPGQGGAAQALPFSDAPLGRQDPATAGSARTLADELLQLVRLQSATISSWIENTDWRDLSSDSEAVKILLAISPEGGHTEALFARHLGPFRSPTALREALGPPPPYGLTLEELRQHVDDMKEHFRRDLARGGAPLPRWSEELEALRERDDPAWARRQAESMRLSEEELAARATQRGRRDFAAIREALDRAMTKFDYDRAAERLVELAREHPRVVLEPREPLRSMLRHEKPDIRAWGVEAAKAALGTSFPLAHEFGHRLGRWSPELREYLTGR